MRRINTWQKKRKSAKGSLAVPNHESPITLNRRPEHCLSEPWCSESIQLFSQEKLSWKSSCKTFKKHWSCDLYQPGNSMVLLASGSWWKSSENYVIKFTIIARTTKASLFKGSVVVETLSGWGTWSLGDYLARLKSNHLISGDFRGKRNYHHRFQKSWGNLSLKQKGTEPFLVTQVSFSFSKLLSSQPFLFSSFIREYIWTAVASQFVDERQVMLKCWSWLVLASRCWTVDPFKLYE